MRHSDGNMSGKDSKGMNELRELDALQAREARPDVEPPDLVDRAVRNMARRTLQDRPAQPIGGKLRWIAGLSTVSVALLAIGISMVQSPRLPPPGQPALKLDQPKRERQPQAALERESLQADSAEARSSSDPGSNLGREAAPASPASLREADALQQVHKSKPEAAAEPAAMAAEEAYSSGLADRAEPADETAMSADQVASPAQAWLDRIQQLYEQGLLAEAAEQLNAFAAEHPGHPLPEWALALRQAPE